METVHQDLQPSTNQLQPKKAESSNPTMETAHQGLQSTINQTKI
jgi:hypothetical protein